MNAIFQKILKKKKLIWNSKLKLVDEIEVSEKGNMFFGVPSTSKLWSVWKKKLFFEYFLSCKCGLQVPVESTKTSGHNYRWFDSPSLSSRLRQKKKKKNDKFPDMKFQTRFHYRTSETKQKRSFRQSERARVSNLFLKKKRSFSWCKVISFFYVCLFSKFLFATTKKGRSNSSKENSQKKGNSKMKNVYFSFQNNFCFLFLKSKEETKKVLWRKNQNRHNKVGFDWTKFLEKKKGNEANR